MSKGQFGCIHHDMADYQQVWEEQLRCVAALLSGTAGNTAILTEHPPVYTMGRSASVHDLVPQPPMAIPSIPVVPTDRGGRVTYHGPGQLVLYLVWDLRHCARAVRTYIYRLEEVARMALASFGVAAQRDPQAPGLWVARDKVAALGVRIRSGIAYHGIAINRAPDLNHFAGIIPCGIPDRGVTSLERLGYQISRAELETALLRAIEEVFHMRLAE